MGSKQKAEGEQRSLLRDDPSGGFQAAVGNRAPRLAGVPRAPAPASLSVDVAVNQFDRLVVVDVVVI